jgi:hypothetical protein
MRLWRSRALTRDLVALTTVLSAAKHYNLNDGEPVIPYCLENDRMRTAFACINPEAAMVFVRSMTSTEVSIEIKTAWHGNRNKQWTANDIYDIDASSLAVPYCDIVVTEKRVTIC